MRLVDIPILNLKISMMRKGNFYVKIPMNWGGNPKGGKWGGCGGNPNVEGEDERTVDWLKPNWGLGGMPCGNLVRRHIIHLLAAQHIPMRTLMMKANMCLTRSLGALRAGLTSSFAPSGRVTHAMMW